MSGLGAKQGDRIRPFELESALIEHPAVAEAAVVPSPDPVRGLKAYVSLAPVHEGSAETARAIFGFLRDRGSLYTMTRRIEFSDLPTTISGKNRRVELRGREKSRPDAGSRNNREQARVGVFQDVRDPVVTSRRVRGALFAQIATALVRGVSPMVDSSA